MSEEHALSDAAEELLAGLWPEQEADRAACPLPDLEAWSGALGELEAAALVKTEAGAVTLTERGHAAAAAVVRRERLAERLLADVLNVSGELAAETACKFEHLLRKGIDDQICTLLGHPRACPHGSPIPPGPCCDHHGAAPGPVISALADLEAGQSGVVAYLHSTRKEIMQRLLAMGAVPGATVVLRQKYPSIVFEIGSSQLAVDEETARDVYVRPLPRARRRRRGWGNPLGILRRG
jgi:DtxR family transcriptional regulator, Mn-dependent transcriptional regulator